MSDQITEKPEEQASEPIQQTETTAGQTQTADYSRAEAQAENSEATPQTASDKPQKSKFSPRIKFPQPSKGAKIFAFFVLVSILSGLLPFFLPKHNSLIKSISVESKILDDFDDISTVKTFRKKLRKVKLNGKGQESASIIHIEGVIQKKNRTYDQERILNLIKDLEENADNKAIILFINSPGGTVYESDEVYLALEKYKTSGKKVYAYLGPMAASGGYYIACAATNIMANRNSLVGSIGTICGQFTDATELLAKIGIKSTTIHSGKNKNMMNFNEAMTEEQQAIMQSLADSAYEQFTGIVAKSRKMQDSKVYALADGRIYSAQQALEHDLIDSICSFEDAKNQIKADLENPNLEIIDEEFEEKTTFYDFLTGTGKFAKALAIFLQTGSISQALRQSCIQLTYPAYYCPL